jgi:hypothetical protein
MMIDVPVTGGFKFGGRHADTVGGSVFQQEDAPVIPADGAR